MSERNPDSGQALELALELARGPQLVAIELNDGSLIQVGTGAGYRNMTLEGATVRIEHPSSAAFHIPMHRVKVLYEFR